MKPKEALKELFNLMSRYQKFELTEGKLIDGTSVFYDIESKEIYVLGASGEKVPAPVGEHELESGELIVVAEEGKISDIKKKDDEPKVEIEVEAAKEEEAAPTEEVKKEEEEIDMKKKFADLEEMVTQMGDKIKKLEEDYSNLVQAQQMSAIVLQELAQEPATKPIQTPNNFTKVLQEEKKSTFGKLQKVFENRMKQNF